MSINLQTLLENIVCKFWFKNNLFKYNFIVGFTIYRPSQYFSIFTIRTFHRLFWFFNIFNFSILFKFFNIFLLLKHYSTCLSFFNIFQYFLYYFRLCSTFFNIFFVFFLTFLKFLKSFYHFRLLHILSNFANSSCYFCIQTLWIFLTFTAHNFIFNETFHAERFPN